MRKDSLPPAGTDLIHRYHNVPPGWVPAQKGNHVTCAEELPRTSHPEGVFDTEIDSTLVATLSYEGTG